MSPFGPSCTLHFARVIALQLNAGFRYYGLGMHHIFMPVMSVAYLLI